MGYGFRVKVSAASCPDSTSDRGACDRSRVVNDALSRGLCGQPPEDCRDVLVKSYGSGVQSPIRRGSAEAHMHDLIVTHTRRSSGIGARGVSTARQVSCRKVPRPAISGSIYCHRDGCVDDATASQLGLKLLLSQLGAYSSACVHRRRGKTVMYGERPTTQFRSTTSRNGGM